MVATTILRSTFLNMEEDKRKLNTIPITGTGKHLARLNRKWLRADIIETRLNEDRKCQEYYVHYEGYDRRLDQWLPINQIRRIPVDKTDRKYSKGKPMSNISENVERKITRGQKRQQNEINHVQPSLLEMDPRTAALMREHEALTRVKYITKIQIGKYEIDTWYFSPYPGSHGTVSKLWICEYCLKYMRSAILNVLHKRECPYRQPPGKKIYNSDSISIWEVDGDVDKLYCQNLCLLAKLFLDHKELYFSVSLFLFYVMCQIDDKGAHIIGYFSKEKQSEQMNNVSCILILPPHQRQGYGKLLIGFSYELSKIEGIAAGPENPLSDFGLVSYRSYWSFAILEQIRTSWPLTVKELSKRTSIKEADIIDTMRSMNLMKYWKGTYVISATRHSLKDIISKHYKFPKFAINRAAIKWSSPVK